ncbi:MAG: hypothetical protein KatS3mg109_0361 [Pirellulaceae bacterium]|nr:MAG: hypothetical protein KatS3mg109_0361 [Pirellulaceae bacterium]
MEAARGAVGRWGELESGQVRQLKSAVFPGYIGGDGNEILGFCRGASTARQRSGFLLTAYWAVLQ